MQHKIKITRAQVNNKDKPIKIIVKPIIVDKPVYTDSDGRVFHQMKPIAYEA